MRRALVLLAVALVCALYLADLTGMGLVSADEPRYADIGRRMAASGDWITPRLWGMPWFEKPALLYWIIAAGFKATADPDLAPRLSIALLSLAFLAFFWFRVRALWDARVASFSTAILSTSAGWLAFSHVAVTDLPLAALFSAAVLLTLQRDERSLAPSHLWLAAVALGLAVLAKSLVPLILFAPVLLFHLNAIFSKRNLPAFLLFFAIAVPWHLLCYARNGAEFLRVLFIEQQFGRFLTPERQHVQPWWFYFPALLLLTYPWFPLLLFVPRKTHVRNVRTLAAVVVFGFVFFSASTNKLNGYLLPLLPSLSILMAIGLVGSKRSGIAIALPVALLGVLPVAANILPQALAQGLSSVPVPYTALAAWVVAAAITGALLSRLPWTFAFSAVAILTAASFLWFQFTTFPAIDAAASARTEWRQRSPQCAEPKQRGILYGLYYYAGRELPSCALLDQPAATVVR